MQKDDDTSRLPNHIALIMDGNGRWAQARGQERREGHRAGVEALRRIVKESSDLGVHHLTVFSFSTENWGRPRTEVSFLMSLLERYIESDLADLHSEGVRVRVIGRREGLSKKICSLIDRAESLTANNNRLYLQIAFNYGGREGHRAGVEALRRIVKESSDLGVHHLTVFSFSTENWGRPRTEVSFLMSLLERYIESDLADLHSEGVRVRVIGRREGLSKKICSLIDRAESLTANNNRLYLQIAFNYGGREELADAASRLARRAANGTLDPESINADVLAAELLTAGMPNPDLIIRTSGESRLSNFMLWQSAYAELYFTDVLWPDFSRADLEAAIAFFADRDRRFGLVSATGELD